CVLVLDRNAEASVRATNGRRRRPIIAPRIWSRHMSAGTRGRRIAGAGCVAALAAVWAGTFTGPSSWTRAVADTCVLSQGYWSQHASAWPVTVLTLGNPANPAHTYSKSELLKILGLASKGDASLILAQQEI